ncbi:hypothetical protein [Ferrovum sp.]|uniref:hypothetical protein n=1 Tax=Ferrovum sp. TaxID=2609467 RepID=UPI0026330AEC|nr:hypothetical protein [Ferrovum sp.]
MELKISPEEVGQILIDWAAVVMPGIKVFNHAEFETTSYGRFQGATLSYDEPMGEEDGE